MQYKDNSSIYFLNIFLNVCLQFQKINNWKFEIFWVKYSKRYFFVTFSEKLKKFIYKNILHKKYYRQGSCKRCGACCSRIYVRHAKNTVADEKEFEKLRYLHPFYSYLKVEGKDEIGLIFSCCNFDTEQHICKIHKTRPGICRRYPDEQIFPMGACLSDGCGYSFTPIDKFKDVLESLQNKPIKNCIIFSYDEK